MGKLKLAILAIIAIAGVAGAVVEYNAASQARDEADKLKVKVAALEELGAHPTQEQTTNASPTDQELQTRDLAKLRAEVAELRKQTNDFAKVQKQVAALNEKLASAAEEKRGLLAAANQYQAQAQQAQAQNQTMQLVRQMNACINNLRLIDSAKQQWALEYKKTATDVPTWDDLRPYLGHGPNGELPTCPGGGTYTIGAVNEKPQCSVQGHALP